MLARERAAPKTAPRAPAPAAGKALEAHMRLAPQLERTIAAHHQRALAADEAAAAMSAACHPSEAAAGEAAAAPLFAAGSAGASAVLLRVRPRTAAERARGLFEVVRARPAATALYYPATRILADASLDVHEFAFDANIAPAADGAAVYAAAARGLVPFVLRARARAAVFAYGQTGSGKTHTMSDLAERIAADLPASGLRIDVSAVEILGDAVRDLFADADAAPAPVRVAVDAAGAVVMSGHRALPAAGPDDVIAAIRRAFASRTTRATLKNDTSSRSHLVLRIALWRPPEVAADASPAGGPHAGETPAGEIKLVDLSGSERVSDTAAHDAERLKESAHINSSLMALKECLRKRSGSPADAKHMPFRNSKLTLLLKDSLELNPDVPTKTVMIACVAPTIADVSHSLNTFRYASTLKTTADDSGAHGSHLKPESAAALAGAAQKPKQTPMAWSKDKLERWLNDKIGGLHSLTTLLGKDGDPRLAGPHRFVPPAWKFIYELPPDEWAKRLAASLSTEEALAVRTEYRKLFVKPRSTVEGQVPGAAADHVESILLAEDAPDVVAAKVTKSSSSLEARQAAALAKLKAKGEAARKKALADQDSSKPVTARSAPRSSN